jgi:hypothetical protein
MPPRPTFKVLSADEIVKLEKILVELEGSHLLRGIAYVEAGVLDEAAAEIRIFASQNPESKAAELLLKHVEQMQLRH